MRNEKNIVFVTFALLAIIILGSGSVLAFAVSMPSMPKDDQGALTLYMMPGESMFLGFTLQNGGGSTTDVSARADIKEGSEIITITDSNNNYPIPAGSRVEVNTEINIPSNAALGVKYPIIVAFAVGDIGGSFFGVAIEKKFNVVVGEEPEKVLPELAPEEAEVGGVEISGLAIILAIIAVIVLVIIIIIIIKRRKNRF